MSGHQKQILFLTRLFVGICSLLAMALFWLANRTSSITR
jgi:hypothetical protein